MDTQILGINAPTTVKVDPGSTPPRVGSDEHVDGAITAAGREQTPQACRADMTQRRVVGAGKKRSGLGSEWDRSDVANRVHPGMEAQKLAAAHQSVDHACAQAGGHELST
jgi:hypothetical protein